MRAHCVIAISTTDFSRRIASSATLALNAAEWLRLGFLMDFLPPVTSSPGQKSTYTRVRKASATLLSLHAAQKLNMKLQGRGYAVHLRLR
jgi:hypothetical protein